jgi:hypothetical protein
MKNILTLLYEFFISIFQMFSFNKRNITAKKLLSGFENAKTSSSLKKSSK